MTMSNAEEIGSQLDTLLMEMEDTSSIIDELGREPFVNYNESEEEALDLELEQAVKDKQKQEGRKKVKE